jgi:hypothetical protein
MRTRQIRRPRPTLATAHEYHRKGSYSVDPARHSVSKEEREAELERVADDLCNLVSTQFPRTQNLEYAILKAHLIIEYALVQYIRGFATTSVEARSIKFSF